MPARSGSFSTPSVAPTDFAQYQVADAPPRPTVAPSVGVLPEPVIPQPNVPGWGLTTEGLLAQQQSATEVWNTRQAAMHPIPPPDVHTAPPPDVHMAPPVFGSQEAGMAAYLKQQAAQQTQQTLDAQRRAVGPALGSPEAGMAEYLRQRKLMGL